MKKLKIAFLLLISFFNQNLKSIPFVELVQEYSAGKADIFDADRVYEDEKILVKSIQEKIGSVFEASKWVDNRIPDQNWFDVDDWKVDENNMTNKFMPYVEKLILPSSAQIAFFGDLHGNYKALIDYLNKLKRLGYLDEDYKICKLDFYMIFLGDYMDRCELFYDFYLIDLLVNFCNQNLGKVFLIRGNHEDLAMPRGDLILTESQKKIFCLFDYLPVAIFLGCYEDDDIINFIQCCHGGIEIGFDPKRLLNAIDKQFQNVFPLQRSENLQSVEVFDAFDCVSRDSRSAFTSNLGFCCGSFNFCLEKNDTLISLGYYLTDKYLSWCCSKTNFLRGIIRGHQHNNEHGLSLYFLNLNRGIFRVWLGLIWTLLSTFFDRGNFRSFVILQMATKFQDWQVTHYYRSIGKTFYNKNHRFSCTSFC